MIEERITDLFKEYRLEIGTMKLQCGIQVSVTRKLKTFGDEKIKWTQLRARRMIDASLRKKLTGKTSVGLAQGGALWLSIEGNWLRVTVGVLSTWH